MPKDETFGRDTGSRDPGAEGLPVPLGQLCIDQFRVLFFCRSKLEFRRHLDTLHHLHFKAAIGAAFPAELMAVSPSGRDAQRPADLPTLVEARARAIQPETSGPSEAAQTGQRPFSNL